MREDESPTRCGCIIPHSSQASILVRKVGDGHEIPSVLLPYGHVQGYYEVRGEKFQCRALEVTRLTPRFSARPLVGKSP